MSSVFRCGLKSLASAGDPVQKKSFGPFIGREQPGQKSACPALQKDAPTGNEQSDFPAAPADVEIRSPRTYCQVWYWAKGEIRHRKNAVIGTTIAIIQTQQRLVACPKRLHQKRLVSHLTTLSNRARGLADCESQSSTPCRHIFFDRTIFQD